MLVSYSGTSFFVFRSSFVPCLGPLLLRVQEQPCSVFRGPFDPCLGPLLFRVQKHSVLMLRSPFFRAQDPFCSMFKAFPVSCSGALSCMFRITPVSCSGAPLVSCSGALLVSCLGALLFLVYFPHTQSRPGDRFFVPFFARRKLVQLLCLNTDQYYYLSLCSQFITHNRPVIRRCVMHETENASTKMNRMLVSVMR